MLNVFKNWTTLALADFKTGRFPNWTTFKPIGFKIGPLPLWSISQLDSFPNLKVSKLDHFPTGQFQNWTISKLDHFHTGRIQNWTTFKLVGFVVKNFSTKVVTVQFTWDRCQVKFFCFESFVIKNNGFFGFYFKRQHLEINTEVGM